jgi:D-amino-acid oxidase
VIGLSTAICLAEDGAAVTVVAAEPPERTTSYAAGAIVGPVFMAGRDVGSDRERESYEEFTRLAAESGTGVRMCTGRFATGPDGAEPPPIQVPAEITPLGPDDLPAPYTVGFQATIPSVDMPVYLAYLRRRFEDAGGRVEIRRLAGLNEATATGPLVANCTGVGARDFVPDPQVRAVRGQHVIVENPGLDTFFIEAPIGPSWAGYFPYREHVVLGGVAMDDDWRLDPDSAVAEQIIERCAAVEPRLGTARVIGHRVGLRPVRPSVRLEAEERDGTRVVHNYGHGGMGVAMSWGSAREAADLLLT